MEDINGIDNASHEQVVAEWKEMQSRQSNPERQQKDLSHLKNPFRWWRQIGIVGFLCAWVGFGLVSSNPQPSHGFSALIVCFWLVLGSFGVVTLCWLFHLNSGHTVLWFMGDHKKWYIIAGLVPEPSSVPGLALEVQVRVKPSVTIWYNGWRFVSHSSGESSIPGDHFTDRRGARIFFDEIYTLDGMGITQEIRRLLKTVRENWKITPLEGGRVLRIQDLAGLVGDIDYKTPHDLHKILTCGSWHSYHLSKIADEGAKQRELELTQTSREELWRTTYGVYVRLRMMVNETRRTSSKARLLQVALPLLDMLHKQLSDNHELRAKAEDHFPVTSSAVVEIIEWLEEHTPPEEPEAQS